MARVARSPRLAAIGVATLSGLMFKLLAVWMTRIMTRPRTKLAAEAVATLEIHSFFKNVTYLKNYFTTHYLVPLKRRTFSNVKRLGVGIHAMAMAKTEARVPTTMAWT